MPKILLNARQIRNLVVIVLLSFVIALPVLSQPLGLMAAWNDPTTAGDAASGPDSLAVNPDDTGAAYEPDSFDDYGDSLIHRGQVEYTSAETVASVSETTPAPTETGSETTATAGETTAPTTVDTPDESAPAVDAPDLQFAYKAVDYVLYINANSLNLRARPTTEADSLAKLSFGTKVQCVGEGSEWLRIVYNDITGFVSADYTSRTMVFESCSKSVYVSSSTLNLRAEPSTDSDIITKLSKNTKLTCTGIGDGWSRVKTSSGDVGYVATEYITTSAPVVRTYDLPASESSGATYTGDVGTLVNMAYSALGVPYVHCGSSMSGFDCSGFVSWCYRQIGITVPRSTSGYYNIGVGVSYDELQPGDIICMDTRTRDGKTSITHVGLYVGEGKMIHASSSKDAVVVCSLANYLNYCKLIGIRRMISG